MSAERCFLMRILKKTLRHSDLDNCTDPRRAFIYTLHHFTPIHRFNLGIIKVR